MGRLNEKYVTVNNGDTVFEDIYVSDSDIKYFIDLKYDADAVVNLAKQITTKNELKDGDLDKAYRILIDNFDTVDNKDFNELNDYIQDCVYSEVIEGYEDDYL